MSLLQYVVSQPPSFIKELLKEESTLRTFIKLLNPLAQHYFFRFLLNTEEISITRIRRGWSSKKNYQQTADALQTLIDCQLLFQRNDPSTGELKFQINPDFREILINPKFEELFTNQETETRNQFNGPSMFDGKVVVDPVDINATAEQPQQVLPETLDNFSVKQLDQILNWMLKLSSTLTNDIKKVLTDSNLIGMDQELTPDGHQFLFADSRKQIWKIVMSYLNSVDDKLLSLRFLLQLGAMEFTKGYKLSLLTKQQKTFMKSLHSLGLVGYGSGFPPGYFYVTRALLNFFGKSTPIKRKGWLIVDTNYKITAYPESKLQVALLSQFAVITYEAEGFVSAFFSNLSFKDAINNGIKIDDILNFLESNISEICGRVPPNIEKQFHVWESQRNRIKTTPNCVMRKVTTMAEKEAYEGLAINLNGYVATYAVQNTYVIITTSEIESEFSNQIRRIR